MSTFLLIRHGTNDWVGRKLAGRLAGVHLNKDGLAQAGQLAERLSGGRIDRVVSSPLERATETAAPLADALGLTVETDESFNEVVFGEWENRSIADLDSDATWGLFNTYRSGTRAPGGELAVEMQARFVAGLERLRLRHPRETIAVVSHADPIRAAIVYYLGMPLDFIHRIEIAPASVSALELNEWGPRLLGLNVV